MLHAKAVTLPCHISKLGNQRYPFSLPVRRGPASTVARYKQGSAAEGGTVGAKDPDAAWPGAKRYSTGRTTVQANLQLSVDEDAEVARHEETVRVVGLGQRGISAATRLMSDKVLQSAEFWMLDTDTKVLSASASPHCIQLPMEDDAQLTADQLERVTGRSVALGPSTASAAAEGRPELTFPITTSGVAFVLAGAGGVPGGSKLALQVATHLRRAGYFVLAALTLPFEFEGRRKVEEASALVEALQDVANLVVVVPQGVLVRASAELTVTQALEIADMTLEASCKAIQWALHVPEVLLASAGGMLWHGRDLRLYRRLLSPPMELLGTCPGAGHVGRGFASMPVQHMAEAGLASGLSTLAETAVVAAAESPFLDTLLSTASGVLCVLSLPDRVLSHDLTIAPGALNDPEKYAIRAAVQVAASMVMDLVGTTCDEVVACAYIRHDWPHKDTAELSMEATLLVVEDPAAADEKEASGTAGSDRLGPTAPTPAATAAARFGRRLSSGPILHPALTKQQHQQQPRLQQVQRRQQQGAAPSGQQRQEPAPQQQLPGPASSRSRAWQQARGNIRERLPYVPAAAAGAGSTAAQRPANSPGKSAAAPQAAAAKQQQQRQPQPQPQQPRQQPIQQQDLQDAGAGPVAGDVQLLPRMADKFVDSMVAQSLDLPPSAARWRHHQRKQNDKQAMRRASGHFSVAAIPWAQPGRAAATGTAGAAGALGQAAGGDTQDVWEEEVMLPPRDVKSRVAGMLQKERLVAGPSSWEEQDEAD